MKSEGIFRETKFSWGTLDELTNSLPVTNQYVPKSGVCMQVKYTPIICPSCKKDTGMKYENFMYYVITHDIHCPHCNAVIFVANNGIRW